MLLPRYMTFADIRESISISSEENEGDIAMSAPTRMVVAPQYCDDENEAPINNIAAAIVNGIRLWFIRVWYCPGVYTAPIAERNVPAQSNNAIIINRLCGRECIAAVMVE
jgi:hypothetical protein